MLYRTILILSHLSHYLQMRKLRESEPCSGNVSKSASHSSIQSVCEELEQNDAAADPVAAPEKSDPTHNQRFSPSAEPNDSTDNSNTNNPTTNGYSSSSSTVVLDLETTTCGGDENKSQVNYENLI